MRAFAWTLAWAAASVGGFAACGTAKVAGAGEECFLATDCAEGLACLPSEITGDPCNPQVIRRVCGSDLSKVSPTNCGPPAPSDAGDAAAGDARPGDAARDAPADAPPVDAPPPVDTGVDAPPPVDASDGGAGDATTD